MTPIGHIATTALLGNNPITCLVWGFVSHWILDETCSEYRPMNILQIAWEGFIALVFVWYTGYWWCLFGILADVIEGVYIAIKGIEVWQSGELLFPFHRYRGQKIWSYRKTLIAEIIFFVVGIIVVKEIM